MGSKGFDLGAELEKIHDNAPRVKAIELDDFLGRTFPPREKILDPWLPAQGLGMIYAHRGTGKTLFALNLAVAVVSGGNFLRWNAPRPRGVLYIDGEMPAGELQKRLKQIRDDCEVKPSASLKLITPDLNPDGTPNLYTKKGQETIEQELNGIDLIIVDSISTLCRGGLENEAESWLPVQDWGIKLRSKGISILFIHHAGKLGEQRGTSRREDTLDTVIALRQPVDYTPDKGACFEIHFKKARGIYGEYVNPFEAMLTNDPSGKQLWAIKNLEESLTEKIAKLLNEGVKQNEVAELLSVAKSTVSKHKTKAQNLGLLNS